MKKALLALGLLLLVMVLLVAVRGMTLSSRQLTDLPATDALDFDANAAARRLGEAVAIPSISNQDPTALNTDAFAALHEHLVTSFPLVHEQLQREVVADWSLLYTWNGSDPGAAPIAILAHQDVVSVEPGTEAEWTHPPFAGAVDDEWIWGRGTLDDKSMVYAAMEAVEALLAARHKPRRTVLLAFGHDEEIGGNGAKVMAARMKERGQRPLLVLDEGAVVTEGIIPGVSAPVSIVGLGEKGYLSVELVARSEGGHSSMPPAETAVGILSRAIVALEDNPMPARLEGPIRDMFECLAADMDQPMRTIMANLWLMRSLLLSRLQKSNGTNAVIRTTTAPTVLEGSAKENVLASQARAIINFRIHPSDSIDAVLDHVQSTIDDERVEIQAKRDFSSEPSPLTSMDGPAYGLVEQTIRQVLPDSLVSPTLVVAATDARHYTGVSDGVLRFMPMRLDSDDLDRIHGLDERISRANYAEAIRFFAQLIRNADHSR
jgi:carboxypeptidase PM20D1